MLRFWNENLEYKSEDGEFKVYIGINSEKVLSEIFTLKTVEKQK